MSLLRLLQFRLEASGKKGWWFLPPWNKKKDRPSVLDGLRLMRKHREQIHAFSRNGKEVREFLREKRHERRVRRYSAGIERCFRSRCKGDRSHLASWDQHVAGGGMHGAVIVQLFVETTG